MRKENVVNKKGLSSRKSFVRDLPSAKSLLNKEQPPYYMKQAEGPGQRPAGTTTFFNNGGFTLFPAPISRIRPYGEYRDDDIFKGVGPVFARPVRTGAPLRSGFTLIELLVVVLIMGILSAVALPQYQKAVEKSRGVQALTLLKSIGQAVHTYHMANGGPVSSFDELDVDVPNWTGTEQAWTHRTLQETRSNSEWSLQLHAEDGAIWLLMVRLSGKYKGGGFAYSVGNSSSFFQDDTHYCVEMMEGNYPFEGSDGDYCVKLFKGTLLPTGYVSRRNYSMPF